MFVYTGMSGLFRAIKLPKEGNLSRFTLVLSPGNGSLSKRELITIAIPHEFLL